MNMLLDAICRAGLNRGLIRDALAGLESFKGVTGQMTFDPNSKNIVPMYLATVRGGAIHYRRYGMEKQYAKVDESLVAYTGPPLPDAPPGPMRLVVFGPAAEKAVDEVRGWCNRWAAAISWSRWMQTSRGDRRPQSWCASCTRRTPQASSP